jgi:hypothetical protein
MLCATGFKRGREKTPNLDKQSPVSHSSASSRFASHLSLVYSHSITSLTFTAKLTASDRQTDCLFRDIRYMWLGQEQNTPSPPSPYHVSQAGNRQPTLVNFAVLLVVRSHHKAKN